MKKINYASMFTLRKDGLYMGYWHDEKKKRHAIYGRDPESLYNRIQEKEKHAPAPLTFEQAAAEWEAKHRERIGHNTAETYKAPLRRILDRYADMNAVEVTAQSVQALLADLGKQGFSRRSVQMHRDILNMIFNNAIVEGKLSFNPCSAVSMPRNLPAKKREMPDDAAIEAVKKSVNVPFGLFAYFCLYSGLRRGELLALRYEDINREKCEICVNKAIEFVGNNPHVKSPKTAAGVRVVPLLAPLAAVLPKNEKGLVFGNEDGSHLTKMQYRKRWLRYCEAIGHDITAHQLRHGYATILYEAGITDKDAQELLGHSSITVTRDIYTHIRSSRRQETVAKLNAFVVS